MFNETDYCSNEMLYITFASRFELQYQKHFSDHYLGINLKTLSSLCFRKNSFLFFQHPRMVIKEIYFYKNYGFVASKKASGVNLEIFINSEIHVPF